MSRWTGSWPDKLTTSVDRHPERGYVPHTHHGAQRAAGCPHAFISGFASDSVKRAVTVPFVGKPFTVESLLSVVGAALGTTA